MPVKHTEESFEIRDSPIPRAGLGLFAVKPIAEEDTIGYYTGKVVTWEELNASEQISSSYVVYVCANHVIVGEGPEANYTRYANHGSRPNALLVTSTRWKSARLEALRDIRPGEEILFDYGEDYWEIPPEN